MNKVKILELFGGIGAIRKAFINLKIPYEVVDYVEIDKACVKSYNALYEEDYKPKSVLGYKAPNEKIDLIMHGSPCQDFSRIGKKQGGVKNSGTRSSLLFETIRIIKEMKDKPKWIIWENVKGVLDRNMRDSFFIYLKELENLGYESKYEILNAMDFGIPQKRERIFVVSCLGANNFSFNKLDMMVLIGLVSILPIAIVNKLFSEERRLHLSQIYATKVTRSQLYWTSIGLSILSGLLGVLLAAGSLGGTAISAMGNSGEMDIVDFFAAGFNLFPTVLFFIGLAALALGWAPKLGKIVYIYLTFSFLLNYFSGLIDLPEWFLNTAIQSWMPQMPMDDFEASVFLTVTIISIALIVIGFLGYSRRDMNEGA